MAVVKHVVHVHMPVVHFHAGMVHAVLHVMDNMKAAGKGAGRENQREGGCHKYSMERLHQQVPFLRQEHWENCVTLPAR